MFNCTLICVAECERAPRQRTQLTTRRLLDHAHFLKTQMNCTVCTAHIIAVVPDRCIWSEYPANDKLKFNWPPGLFRNAILFGLAGQQQRATTLAIVSRLRQLIFIECVNEHDKRKRPYTQHNTLVHGTVVYVHIVYSHRDETYL